MKKYIIICKTFITFICIALVGNASFAAQGVPVQGSAAMKAPAANAAVVSKLIGLVNNRHAKTLTGIECTINDGIVIRQSYIENGKIIIPPEGLFVTARSDHNLYPFDNEPYTIAGRNYYAIVDRYIRDVVRNVVMKKGDIITTNAEKSRGVQLTNVVGGRTFGLPDGKDAMFKMLKTTGNYYGTDFIVYVGSSITNAAADGSLANGSNQPEGHTVPNDENNLSRFDYGTNVSTTGRTYVVVEKIDKNNHVYVKEFATDSTTDFYISPSEPVIGSYANGESFAIGDAKISVNNITESSVDIAIASKLGDVTTKKLYIDQKNSKWLMQSMVERDKCYVVSKDGKTLVHLNIRPGNPFNAGKVNLIAFTDVINVQNGLDWPFDNRFLARPESCATCTYTHEVMLANKEPIILDGGKNREYSGPENQFKIVIDEFDGKTVRAWHIETTKAKTANLAVRADGRHIDLVVGKACRSTAHFINRWLGKMYDEHLNGRDVFK